MSTAPDSTRKQSVPGTGSQKSKYKKEHEDPLAILRRKFQAKCRFRALVRRVIENLYWLTQEQEVYEGDDVKRRVEQAMRLKPKKEKALLSIADKSLLTKPAEDRTITEKKYIYRKIGSLKCFKRYPNHVKKKLAAATYFKYYGPGRTIVRQNHDAHALYFIVTGEVVVSVVIWDELLQKYISINVFVMHQGDMFGEVSLLHNIKRTATCTTSEHCEFLALMKEDFKTVLQDSLQKQWDKVQGAMCRFTYFSGLDEVARREGCILAKMKSYNENDTILGDGKGVQNFVYFVLSGRCQMIETLKVLVNKEGRKKHFTLYDPFIPKVESDMNLDDKYFKTVSKILHTTPQTPQTPAPASCSTENRTSITKEGNNPDQSHRNTNTSGNEIQIPASGILLPSAETRYSFKLEPIGPPPDPKNVETYFMQVCIFNAGSTFGFGENMRDRRIVALTKVDCMLLPMTWLMQRNTANIWSRLQHYLERKIPTKKQIFKEFVLQRQWEEHKKQLVDEIARRHPAVNYTTIHDVPYSTRMEQMMEL